MILCIIMEILKIFGWLAVIYILVKHRKHLFATTFILMFTSSIVMILSSIDDLGVTSLLCNKSIGWFIANIFIIWTFINIILKYSKQIKNNGETIRSFIEKIEVDTKDIKNILEKK